MRTDVIEKSSLPLFHGKEYSSDSEGDGPGVDKATFFEVWPLVSLWIKQNNRAQRVYLANAWGNECDEQLLLKAFARLYMWRYRDRDEDDEPQFDEDGVEIPYPGWTDYQPSFTVPTFLTRAETNIREIENRLADDRSSEAADEDSELSSIDEELELVHEDRFDYFQRGYGPMPPSTEPPSSTAWSRVQLRRGWRWPWLG